MKGPLDDCQTQSYLRIGQRYLRMTQNPLLHVVCCRIDGAAPQDNCVLQTPMAASLKLLPGSTLRWRGRRYLIVDYESLDAIIARQPATVYRWIENYGRSERLSVFLRKERSLGTLVS
jgi:hypothetical protein